MSAIAELSNELWTLQLWVSGSKGKCSSEIAAAHCRRFCLMCEGVRASGNGDNLWQFKPKLQQELVEYQSHDYGSRACTGLTETSPCAASWQKPTEKRRLLRKFHKSIQIFAALPSHARLKFALRSEERRACTAGCCA